MNYTIDQIEDAILAKLRATSLGGYCQKIDTYGGPIVAESVKDFMAGVKSNACFVHYRDGVWRDDETTKAMVFIIIVMAKNLRGGAAARKGGGPQEIGAYQMLEDVKSALKQQQLGLDIIPLKPRRESIVGAESHIAIYAIEFETYFHEE